MKITLLGFFLFIFPFAVMALLLSCGFNTWACVAICVALLGSVVWGVAGNQIGGSDE